MNIRIEVFSTKKFLDNFDKFLEKERYKEHRDRTEWLQCTHDFYITLISQNFLVKLSSSNKKRNQQLATATKKK